VRVRTPSKLPRNGILFALVLVGLLIPLGVRGQQGAEESYLPPDARLWALEDLSSLRSCSGAAPSDPAVLLQTLRSRYLLAVDDRPALAEAWDAHSALARSPWVRSGEGRAVLEAYRGALYALEARHGFWPTTRLRELRRGLDLLDAQVRERPDHLEVRYLRLVSTAFLPGIAGRSGTVDEDLDAMARILPPAVAGYSLRSWTAMADAVEGVWMARRPNRASALRSALVPARQRAGALDLPLVPGCRVQ